MAFLTLMAAAFVFCALIANDVVKPGLSSPLTRLGESVLRTLGLLLLLKPD